MAFLQAILSYMSSCCENANGKGKLQIDWILHGSTLVIIAVLSLYAVNSYTGLTVPFASEMGQAIAGLLSQMWWGVVLGIIAVGLMGGIPKHYYTYVLGHGDTAGGIVRAALAGLLLDMCSHGILMVGAKLYERGASLAQVMTFLIASPWNSLSLTFILIALIGLKWTLVFIAGSVLIAIISGFIFRALVRAGTLPANTHTEELPHDFNLVKDAKERLKGFRFNGEFIKDVARNGWVGGKMVLRWLLFGTILAAAIRTFVPTEIFQDWFGPTLMGLFLTLIATTIIEVCSEGSAPIAADLLNRAGAPGNGFAFLMAGVATDYTEILVLREATRSWKIAFFLPLVTVPQVLVLGYLMNL
jgi:hypothetical protein